jgi:cathepsin D
VVANKPDLPNAMAIDEDASDYSYFAQMRFGSNGTPMYMLIDTGSANTWVMGTECATVSCDAHNLFGPPNSTTLNLTKTPWTVTYGTGAVEGVTASDTVAFANYSLEIGFGLATTASADFLSYPMDGILGLGRSASDIIDTPTIMDVLDKKNMLASNIIGIHLQRASDGMKDGQITFGGVDKTKFKGDISYTKALPNQGAWEIPVSDSAVHGISTNFTARTAIIDTGTSFILMPPSDANAFHHLIPGAVVDGGSWDVPCSTTAEVQFTFSGVTYSVSPKDYVGKPNNGAIGACASNIIGHQPFGPTQWLLGDVFLKNVYTVFDYDKESIGFGTMNGVAAASSSAAAASSSATSSSRASSMVAPGSSAKTSSSASTTSSSSSSSAASAAATTTDASPLGGADSGASSYGMSLGLAMVAAFVVGLLV